jgi:hypothetical protein
MANDKIKSYTAVLTDKSQSIEGLTRELMEVLMLLDQETLELDIDTRDDVCSGLLTIIKHLDSTRLEISSTITTIEGKIPDPGDKPKR